jgi:hypothetical protein
MTIDNNSTSGNVNLLIKGNITPTSDIITGIAPNQLVCQGATNNNYQLLAGFNTTDIYGGIQAVTQGTGYNKLCLNPFSGNVSINQTTNNYPLDVNGTINTNSGILLPTSGGTAALLTFNETGVTTNTTITWGFYTGGAITLTMSRIGNIVTIFIPNFTYNPGSSVNALANSNTAIPSRYRPASTSYFQTMGMISGSNSQLFIGIFATGLLQFGIPTGTNLINGTSFQIFGSSITFQYNI